MMWFYNVSCNKSIVLGGFGPQTYGGSVSRQRTELSREILDALRLEVTAQIRAEKWSQSSLAAKAGYSQPAVSKVMRGLGVGREVAEALLKHLGFSSFDELVAKHRTAVTANDVAVFLDKYKGLAETLREDPTRWDIGVLSKVIVDARRDPPRSRPDGHLVTGSWREVLDETAVEMSGSGEGNSPKKVGGTRKFREQVRGPGK
jgi:predicted transcriptional regulator